MKSFYRGFLLFLTLFLAVAALAKTKRYELHLANTVQASGVELKSGTYQVEEDQGSLVFYQGKKEIAKVPVRSEDIGNKNEVTSFTIANNKLMAVQLGGTKTKLVVEGSK